jgi:hypothetical protein
VACCSQQQLTAQELQERLLLLLLLLLPELVLGQECWEAPGLEQAPAAAAAAAAAVLLAALQQQQQQAQEQAGVALQPEPDQQLLLPVLHQPYHALPCWQQPQTLHAHEPTAAAAAVPHHQLLH